MSWLAIIGCAVGVLLFAAIMTWITVYIVLVGVFREIVPSFIVKRTNKDGGAQ